MKLFGWLRKQYEKRLPYRIIDVAPDELLTYVGKGKYPVLCKQEDKHRIIEQLLTHPEVRQGDASDAMQHGWMIIIWHTVIDGWPIQMCKRHQDTTTWLRVVEPKGVDVDDLI